MLISYYFDIFVCKIINILDGEGIKYRLDNNTGQVLVNENDISQIRMLLAAKGIKAQLPSGLETLDNSSSLGTSQFIENAKYRHVFNYYISI